MKKIHIKNGRLIDPASGTDDARTFSSRLARSWASVRRRAVTPRIARSTPADLSYARAWSISPCGCASPASNTWRRSNRRWQAAAAGGVTSLACPPDTDPPLDEPGLVEMLKFRASNLNQSHVYPVGALTVGLKGTHLTEMAELTDAGCVAFSHADAPLTDTQLLLRAHAVCGYFRFSGVAAAAGCGLARGGVAHDGEVATRLGLAAIPVCAETVALSTILLLARETGARIHYAGCRARKASTWFAVAKARRG